jgi:hypothetical protein
VGVVLRHGRRDIVVAIGSSCCGDTSEGDFRKGQLSSSRISLGLSLDLIFQSKRKTYDFIKIIKLSEAISICLK